MQLLKVYVKHVNLKRLHNPFICELVTAKETERSFVFSFYQWFIFSNAVHSALLMQWEWGYERHCDLCRFVIHDCLKRSQFCIMNDIVNIKKGHNIVNDTVNDKKGHNIVNNKQLCS